MNERLLIPLPFAAVLLAVSVFLLVRGGGSPGATAEASGQVAAAFSRVKELNAVSMRQRVTSKIEGEIVSGESVVRMELPDRAYATTTSNGRNVEMVILGELLYIRQEPLPWQTRSIRDLGMNPDAIYNSNEEQLLPSELRVLGTVTEGGRRLVHYRGHVDGEKYLELLSSFFVEGSPMRRGFSDARIEKLEIDYYIGEADDLPYRATVQMKMSLGSQDFEAISSVEYFDFDVPLTLPSDLPR
jgi:hypothetical protein